MNHRRSLLHSINRYSISIFFLVAGLNHFLNPEFYLPLLPPYLPFPEVINIASGILEITFAGGILFPKMRYWSAMLGMGLLLAFIPAHVYFIQLDGCIKKGLCTPLWVAWIRLILIHPLLLLWVWSNRK